MERKLFDKTGLWLIAGLAVLSAALLLYRYRAPALQPTASVSVDGALVLHVDLQNVEQNTTYTLENGIILQVTAQGICFLHSDCPDGVCMKSGVISHPGETIACVPNKTVVAVTQGQSDVDIMTY